MNLNHQMKTIDINTLFAKIGLTVCALFLCIEGMQAQSDTIKLSNPSFEDIPRQGGAPGSSGIKGWFDCGGINFPGETPPDIHPKDFWQNTKQAFEGKTYLGMVTRDNDSWESVSQRLPSSMIAGDCYRFSIMLSKSERYMSQSRKQTQYFNNNSIFSYTTPIVLRIWGGSGYCDTRELLGESSIIDHTEWKTYAFKLSPELNHKFITIEAFYKVPVIVPYNGHILVDDCSHLVKLDCSEEVLVNADPPAKKLPPHKRVKKKKKTDVDTDQNDKTKIVEAKKTAKAKLFDIDRKDLQKGQTIEIENLYFDADQTQLGRNSYATMDNVYDFLNQNKDIVIEIGGHTNGLPKHEYCDQLSEERAKSVAKYLVEQGIDGERIFYKGYGKRKSIASNLTAEGRKKNQRVEIKILSIG